MAAGKLGKRRDVLVSLVDPHFQLEVMNRWWGPAFADGAARTRCGPSSPTCAPPATTGPIPTPTTPSTSTTPLQVHRWAEELLRAVGAPEADTLAELSEAMRWESLHSTARRSGQPETEVLFEELVRLEAEQESLNIQLEEARDAASTATGRSRAMSRQLAELQAQYAAVAGLRDDYLALQRQLDAERGGHEADERDTGELRERLARTAESSERLAAEAEVLRAELERTRQQMEVLDPVDTEIGRRWIWLVTVLHRGARCADLPRWAGRPAEIGQGRPERPARRSTMRRLRRQLGVVEDAGAVQLDEVPHERPVVDLRWRRGPRGAAAS